MTNQKADGRVSPSGKVRIGIDLGGTNVKCVAVDEGFDILNKTVEKTIDRGKEIDPMIQILSLIKDTAEEYKISGIGIAVPCVVNPQTGKIYPCSNNVSPWTEMVDLKTYIEKEFGSPVYIDNDANLGALAESHFGAGEEFRKVAFVALGTGIGSGIIIDGEIIHGCRGGAGEVGFTIIRDEGKVPIYFEDLASQRSFEFFANQVGYKNEKMKGEPSSLPELIHRDAEKGGKKALKIFSEVGKYLAIGLANLANTINPEVIVLGGGVANAGKILFEPTKKEIKRIFENTRVPSANRFELKKAEMGYWANGLGAAYASKKYL